MFRSILSPRQLAGRSRIHLAGRQKNICTRAHKQRFYRNYMGAAFLLPPKITTLRLVFTGGMTAIGYITYKLNGK